MVSRFDKANELARKKAEKIKDNYLAIIQTGSSLRKQDFTPYSDVDLYGIMKEKPEELFDHSYEEEIDLSVIRKSVQKFEEDLKKGNPFELVSIKYGKPLHGTEFIQDYKHSNYGSGRQTYVTWIQSALNHYQDMIFDRYMPLEFYDSAYHSYREFARYLILNESNKIVEGDSMIKENLEKINNDFAKNFWDLREKRFDPPSFSHDYIEVKKLLQAKEFNVIKKIDDIGEKVFKKENLTFPTLEKINEVFAERGLEILIAPHYSFREEQKMAFLSGEDEEGTHKSFHYDMETGDLKEIGKGE